MATRWCQKCEENKPIEFFKFEKSSCYDCQLKRARDWKSRNKEKVKEYMRQWKETNKEHVSSYNARYDAANKDTIRPRALAYQNARLETDIQFKLSKYLRNRFRKVLKSGRLNESSLSVLGCTIDQFKAWLEYRFTDDMTFDNHGTVWELDHVVPISKFELADNEIEIRKCFHWSNFQPLTSLANKSKNCNVTQEEIMNHERHLDTFFQSLSAEERRQYSMVEIDRMSYVSKPRKQRSNRGATKVSQE